MSQQQNVNRTRNNTMYPPSPDANRSNGSGVAPDSGNGNRSDMGSVDDSPEAMFYLLTTLIIPSIICFIFLFYNFIRLPNLRTKPTNLFIICLLIINFIHILADLPFRLYFLSQNQVLISSPTFCLIWTWYDNILTTADLFIMASTSIERYLFVFHHIFLRHYKRVLYKIPIVVCFIIPIIWYTVLIFAYPCQNSFKYFTFQCGTLCYLTDSLVFMDFENFVFFMFPLLIIAIGNSSLIICVLIQKRSMKRKHRLGLWRNNFRMISQLMLIATLYMSIYIPSCILLIFGSYVRRGRFQPWAASVRSRYFIHLKYLVIFGCPFMVLAGQKEMHEIIKKTFYRIAHPLRTQWKTQTIPLTTVPVRMNGTLSIRH